MRAGGAEDRGGADVHGGYEQPFVAPAQAGAQIRPRYAVRPHSARTGP
jgi:hypothetical protein